MMTIRISLLISFFMTLCHLLLVAQCNSNIYFTSQSQIDDFSVNNPFCSFIQGNVIIEESSSGDITDLSGLSQLVGVGGALEIKSNDQLQDLIGLENIIRVDGKLRIINNQNLSTINLTSLYQVGSYVSIVNNDALGNLDLLNDLVFVNGYLAVYDNDILTSIAGLGNLKHEYVISQNPSVSDFEIHDNSLLTTCASPLLCGAITDSIHTFDIRDNSSNCSSASQVYDNCEPQYTTNLCFDTVFHTPYYPNGLELLTFAEKSVLGDGWFAATRYWVDDYEGIYQIVFFEFFDSVWMETDVFESSPYDEFQRVTDMNGSGDKMIMSVTTLVSTDVFPYAVVFSRDDSTSDWTQWSTYSAATFDQGDYTLSDLSDSFAAVSFKDTIFLFEDNGNGWDSILAIPNAAEVEPGASLDVALDNGNLVFSGVDETKYYEYDGTNWQFKEVVMTANSTSGGTIEMHEDQLVLYHDDDSSIFYFQLINDSWSNTDQINLPDGFYIFDMSIYADRLFVGGRHANGTYLVLRFQYEDSQWVFLETIEDQTPISTPPQYGLFGSSISQNASECLITDNYSNYGAHDFAYPYGDALLVSCMDSMGGSDTTISSVCPTSGLTLVRQSQIDSFQVLFPNCTQIPGDLLISEDAPGDITNLDSLAEICYIYGSLTINGNDEFTSTSGLSNLKYVADDILIYENDSLFSINLPNLVFVGGEFGCYDNSMLGSIEGMPHFTYLENSVKIYSNPSLEDISALGNLSPFYISSNGSTGSDIEIFQNPLLSECSLTPICMALNDGQHTSDIRQNKTFCNTEEEVRIECLSVNEGADCPNMLDLQGQMIIEGRYKAVQLLVSDNVVQSGDAVIYQSAEFVDLIQGFEVEPGAEFIIQIVPCVPE